MMIVKFSRIGRTGSAPESALTVKDIPDNITANDLAELLYGYVGKFLLSRDYWVDVDLGADRVFIAGGRFGQGVIEREAVNPVAEAHAEALREDWARSQVAAAGESWTTHMTKFDGTVLPRPSPSPHQLGPTVAGACEVDNATGWCTTHNRTEG